MIDFYNLELERYVSLTASEVACTIDAFIDTDSTKISWTRSLKQEFKKRRKLSVSQGQFIVSMNRPFSKQWMYFSRKMNEMVYQMPQMLPSPEAKNRLICIAGIGVNTGFSTLMVDSLPSLDMLSNGQCFPLRLFSYSGDLFSNTSSSRVFQIADGITDEALKYFGEMYPDRMIRKDDIFYYIYGLLHSEIYRTSYKNNLAKQLPRIPAVRNVKDFDLFADSGRKLADLHVNYENVDPALVTINDGKGLPDGIEKATLFNVKKMRFGGRGGGGRKIGQPLSTMNTSR